MKKKEKEKKKKSNRLVTALLILVLVAGVAIFFYPMVSSWWNDRVQSRAISVYNETVSTMEEEDLTAYLEAAESYNEKLYELGSANVLANTGVLDEEYWDLLDVTGTGIMGYITIEKLDLELPIYHGTDSSVLSKAIGHLEGSSLPIGGESTHTVLSGHTGLPSATLFTHLDRLEVGDTFTITVLDELLTYEVDQIKTVLPSEIEDLYIKEGQDYCTLITCTPYGINTHRLLVRGHRIENAEAATNVNVTADAEEVQPLLVAAIIGAAILLILFIIFLLRTRRKKRKKPENTEKM